MGSCAALNKLQSPQLFWMIYFSLLQTTYTLLYWVFFHLAEKQIVSYIYETVYTCAYIHIYIHTYMHMCVYIYICKNL